MHERLRIDMVKVEAWMNPAVEALHIPECDGPWQALERLDQVDRRWAELHRNPDNFNYNHLPDFVESWDATGNPPAIQLGLGGLFGVVRRLRGDTQALIDLADGHEIMIHILDTMEHYCSGLIDKVHSAWARGLTWAIVGTKWECRPASCIRQPASASSSSRGLNAFSLVAIGTVIGLSITVVAQSNP